MELSESALRDCSLCDLLLCHLMNRFLERKESECDLELPSKRRKKLYSLQSVLDAKSSVRLLFSFHLVLCAKGVPLPYSPSYALQSILGGSSLPRPISIVCLFVSNRGREAAKQLITLQLEFLALFPREFLSSEVSIGSSRLEDGLIQSEITDDAARTKIEVLIDDLDNFGLRVLGGSVRVDMDGERVVYTNRIGELDQTTVAHTGVDKGLGNPTRSVSSRAIHLRRILSREGTASMGSPTTIGIDNDLTTCQTRVSAGSTDHKATRGVQVEDCLVVQQLGRDDGLDDVFHEIVTDLLVADVVVVLGRDNHSVYADRNHVTMVFLILNCNLSLSIRTNPLESSILADIGKSLAQLGGK